jgi:hypothetical protein
MNAQQPPSPNRYLELLNFKTREEAYQKVKEMASNLTEDQHAVRSCIFGFEEIGALNETRNLAAHQSDITKVLYKGRSPFSDPDCFAQMYFDVWAIKQSMPKFFWHTIEKPREKLRRYYEKFGEI